MKDTAFYVPEDKLDRFAGYYRKQDGGLKQIQQDGYRKPPNAPSGGGGLVSTVDDYLKFCSDDPERWDTGWCSHSGSIHDPIHVARPSAT